MESNSSNPSRVVNPVLDLSHVHIEVPDYEEMKQKRIGRNRQAMEAADKRLAKEIFPEAEKSSVETRSAICFQRMWRGVMGRRKYVDLLYEQYEKEYQQSQNQIAKQMKDGELLVDNRDLELSLRDGQTVRRNRTRQYLSQVTTIQRAWRQYQRNKTRKPTLLSEACAEGTTTTTSDTTVLPNLISQQHQQQNQSIVCQNNIGDTIISEHEDSLTSKSNLTACAHNSSVVNSNEDNLTSHSTALSLNDTLTSNNNSRHDEASHSTISSLSNTNSNTAKIPVIIVTNDNNYANEDDNKSQSTINLATQTPPNDDHTNTTTVTRNQHHQHHHQQQQQQNHYPESTHNSDHEDEPSETESTIAAYAMNDLTPEENQGGTSNFPTSSSSDSISGADELPSLILEAEGQEGLSITTSGSPSATGAGPVVLDAAKVLSGLEKRDRLSPSRYSVDVECDSVTSDYSELGGTLLRDIEKDVCYLDREALLSGGGGRGGLEGESDGEGAGGVAGLSLLAQLGLRRDSSDSSASLGNYTGNTNSNFPPREKQENESEADFQKRLRKVSILSLAQEFALLKKVDSQACPISFHITNKDKQPRLGHSGSPSPVSSRGQSVERSGTAAARGLSCGSRRTLSKSPLRTTNTNSNSNSNQQPNSTTAMQHQQLKPAPPPTAPSLSLTEAASSSCSSSLSQQQHSPPKTANPTLSDLPINELRRRNSGESGNTSDDLPVNMRPERRILMQQQLQQEAPSTTSPPSNKNGSGGDGDFDVYNIEKTISDNLDWKTLQQQIERKETEGKTRLQACKNEREEIRRRLAMTDDDKEDNDDGNDDNTDDDNLTGSMLSNPRLQTSLEGAQNMQICFIPDDILDDDEDDDITIGSHVINDVRGDRTGCDDVISTSEEDTLSTGNESNQPTTPSSSGTAALSNRRPDPKHIATRQSQLQTEATLALAQASTMARMQLEVERQNKKKSPIADMVGIPTLGNGRRLRLSRSKMCDMNVAQLQVIVNDLHSQIELLNEDLVHLLIERDDLHMEQDSMLVDIEDLTSQCPDPKTTNNNKTSHNNNRPGHRKDVRRH